MITLLILLTYVVYVSTTIYVLLGPVGIEDKEGVFLLTFVGPFFLLFIGLALYLVWSWLDLAVSNIRAEKEEAAQKRLQRRPLN
ncbi:MAG TPA: hypothetical protein VIK37_00210 [Candidatus Saccharimonadales bacterium]